MNKLMSNLRVVNDERKAPTYVGHCVVLRRVSQSPSFASAQWVVLVAGSTTANGTGTSLMSVATADPLIRTSHPAAVVALKKLDPVFTCTPPNSSLSARGLVHDLDVAVAAVPLRRGR